MNQDAAIRARLASAVESLPIDADDSLARFHDVRPRRVAVKRRVTAVAALAIGAAAIVAAWVALPMGADRGNARVGDDPTSTGLTGRIAYMVIENDGQGATLATTDADTGAIRQLPGGPYAVYPVWSPDGTRVAYIAGSDYDHTELTVANGDGSDPRSLGVEVRGPFSWSPDGAQIAYIRSSERPNGFDVVAVIGADGSNDREVLAGLEWQSVSWSPNGDRLLLVGHPESDNNIAGPAGWDIYSARPDGTDVVQLTRSREWEHLATWSPDGRSILFTRSTDSSDDADYTSDLWIMAADGSDARALTDWRGFDAWPVWSPDGRWIAFASDRDASPEEQVAFRRGDAFSGVSMFVMRPDGTDVRRLVTAGDGEVLVPASWSSAA